MKMHEVKVTIDSFSVKVVAYFHAQMVKLVDTPDLGSGAARCVGSSPILGIFFGHFP